MCQDNGSKLIMWSTGNGQEETREEAKHLSMQTLTNVNKLVLIQQ